MNNKELLKDLNKLLKKHKAYMRADEDWISIINEDTNKPIQSFYCMIDTVGLDFRLSDVENENE